MSNWPTQPPENPEQERERAERLRHQEAVSRWRTPAETPLETTKDKDLPKVSTGNGSFALPSLDRDYFFDFE